MLYFQFFQQIKLNVVRSCKVRIIFLQYSEVGKKTKNSTSHDIGPRNVWECALGRGRTRADSHSKDVQNNVWRYLAFLQNNMKMESPIL